MTPTIASEIERYLHSGDTDAHCAAWPSYSIVERGQQARKDLRGALVAEVLRRSQNAVFPDLPGPEETIALTRRRVEPMVRGLFSRVEQDLVLAMVERSVLFLTPTTIASALHQPSFHRSAWNLANLYLSNIDAELLGPDARPALGMSLEATCFVAHTYFDDAEPFADYLVHEVAHLFHNCKRHAVGLPFTRRKEWLLDIDFPKRETFAWSCEAFACIVDRAPRIRDRSALADAFADDFNDCWVEGIDAEEVIDIVREASTRRNGWKAILARCAPRPG